MEESGGTVGTRVGTFACVFPHMDLQLIIPGAEAEGKMRDEEAKTNTIQIRP